MQKVKFSGDCIFYLKRHHFCLNQFNFKFYYKYYLNRQFLDGNDQLRLKMFQMIKNGQVLFLKLTTFPEISQFRSKWTEFLFVTNSPPK